MRLLVRPGALMNARAGRPAGWKSIIRVAPELQLAESTGWPAGQLVAAAKRRQGGRLDLGRLKQADVAVELNRIGAFVLALNSLAGLSVWTLRCATQSDSIQFTCRFPLDLPFRVPCSLRALLTAMEKCRPASQLASNINHSELNPHRALTPTRRPHCLQSSCSRRSEAERASEPGERQMAPEVGRRLRFALIWPGAHSARAARRA